jgi:3-deoxy-7-phosphoheptulonate synthase
MIEAIGRTGRTVLWVCDPMHGNTETTASGDKTRRFENILKELSLAFDIHRELGGAPGRRALRVDRGRRHRLPSPP